MSDGQPTLDERIAALGKLAERLEQRLPAPPPPPPRPSPPASSDPLASVRVVLSLFAFVAGWLLVQDALAIFVVPDDRVFVSLEGSEFQVWRNVHAYEAATGK